MISISEKAQMIAALSKEMSSLQAEASQVFEQIQQEHLNYTKTMMQLSHRNEEILRKMAAIECTMEACVC